MNEINDISLIAQVLVLKNTRAFDKLVKKYQSQVRRFFLNQTCGDEYLSDDLAQETFIKVYKNLGKFKNLSNFSTWLYRIAYNVFYDYIRQKKEMANLESSNAEKIHFTESNQFEKKNDIYLALNQLKDTERTCVTLFYMEDVSIDKISKIVNCPSGTVKSHLSRGKKKMAAYLKQNGYDGKR